MIYLLWKRQQNTNYKKHAFSVVYALMTCAAGPNAIWPGSVQIGAAVKRQNALVTWSSI